MKIAAKIYQFDSLNSIIFDRFSYSYIVKVTLISLRIIFNIFTFSKSYKYFVFRGSYLNADFHCVKSVCIRSNSGPYFRAFGLNTERYGVFLRIQSECGKMRTKITPNTDIFHTVFKKETQP